MVMALYIVPVRLLPLAGGATPQQFDHVIQGAAER